MRVAIRHKDGSISAYRLGRVEDGVHNLHPVFGLMPMDEFVDVLVRMAQEEFPDEEVVVQRMVMSSDDVDESDWIDVEEFDPEVHTPTRPGNQISGPDLTATVGVNS